MTTINNNQDSNSCPDYDSNMYVHTSSYFNPIKVGPATRDGVGDSEQYVGGNHYRQSGSMFLDSISKKVGGNA